MALDSLESSSIVGAFTVVIGFNVPGFDDVIGLEVTGPGSLPICDSCVASSAGMSDSGPITKASSQGERQPGSSPRTFGVGAATSLG